MLDLDVAARDLIAHPVRPPTPVSELASRVRRRRLRRRAGGGLAGLMAVGLILSLVQVTRDGQVAQKVSNAPGYASLPGTGVTPPGWIRINYDRASIAVPPGWKVASASGGCSGYLDTVYLGGGGETPGCVNDLTPAEAVFVILMPMHGKPTPGTALDINNHRAIQEPVSTPNRVVTEVVEFPDLGLQYESFGAVGDQIAATVGWSAGYLALHPSETVSIPSGWRTIRYDGISLSVPPSWPITKIGSSSASPGACAHTEFAQPAALEGTGFEPACAFTPAATASQGTDGVWLRPDPSRLAQPPGSTLLHPHRPQINLVGQTQQYGEGVLSLIITPPNDHPVDLDIGVGPDPTVAQAILASIS